MVTERLEQWGCAQWAVDREGKTGSLLESWECPNPSVWVVALRGLCLCENYTVTKAYA